MARQRSKFRIRSPRALRGRAFSSSVSSARDISSSVRQGRATVTVELELDRNVDVAVQEVQTKISQVQRSLPKDIDPPTVTKVNPAQQPIIWLTLHGDRAPRELMKYVQDHLQDQFATISGVGEVTLGGFVAPNLRVWLDADKMIAHELTVDDVVAAITREHSEIPAGRIETPTSEQNVRAMGEAGTAAQELEQVAEGGELI